MALPYSPEALAFRNDLVLAICNGGFGKHYEAGDAFMASHISPLLAALQQVTAEKRSACLDALAAQDQAAENDERARTAEAALDTATAEAARLRAEVEVKDRALNHVKRWINTDLPAGTSRAGTAHRVITKALGPTALARAATAREG